MPSLALTREQSRQVDRVAIEKYGIAGLVLMENAGRGVVDVLESIGIDGSVLILCGKGNNAGDGFVIARHLAIRGYDAQVALLSAHDGLHGDAKVNFEILKETKVPVVDLSACGDRLHDALQAPSQGSSWIVDALLGTGMQGEPRAPFDTAIDWMNAQSLHRLAVDVPSGLDCDSGLPARHTVRADHTCTFFASKVGFHAPTARGFVGQLHVCDIGVPGEIAMVVMSG